MRNLLYLIYRYSAFLVFILLELFCLYLITNYNKSQKEIWAHSSNLFSGNVSERVQKAEDFFTLRDQNDSLTRENAKLLETIINFRINADANNFVELENINQDSTAYYTLIPAKVCGKTINLRNNFITICAGHNQGLAAGMGVISKDGVVGIIKSVSDDYATVLLIINSQSRISALIKNKEYHGNLVWNSEDVREMKLMDVPKHADISIGDTVVTSGYSISFPKFIHLGSIKDMQIVGGSNNFDIDVELSYDIAKVSNVYVVSYNKAEEKAQLMSVQDE